MTEKWSLYFAITLKQATQKCNKIVQIKSALNFNMTQNFPYIQANVFSDRTVKKYRRPGSILEHSCQIFAFSIHSLSLSYLQMLQNNATKTCQHWFRNWKFSKEVIAFCDKSTKQDQTRMKHNRIITTKRILQSSSNSSCLFLNFGSKLRFKIIM